jgi:hypothetical protein
MIFCIDSHETDRGSFSIDHDKNTDLFDLVLRNGDGYMLGSILSITREELAELGVQIASAFTQDNLKGAQS